MIYDKISSHSISNNFVSYNTNFYLNIIYNDNKLSLYHY